MLSEARWEPDEQNQENVTDSSSLSQDGVMSSEDIIRQVVESYEKFKSASSQNDWQAMGDRLAELDKAIEDLKKAE